MNDQFIPTMKNAAMALPPEWCFTAIAQKQTTGFIGTRTKITFDKTPGLPLEKGKKVTYTVKEVEIMNYEYAGKVDFVQKATIKPGVKEVKGTITYQTCTHEHCLTPVSMNFSVPVK
jgi:hypothetical protein